MGSKMNILAFLESQPRRRNLQFLLIGVCAASLVAYLQNTLRGIRPTQDDYAILGQVADYGIGGMLLETWNNHGGNLFPMFINALSLFPSQKSFDFYGLTLLAITTLVLLLFAFQSVFVVFFPSLTEAMGAGKILGFSAFFILGFESFFTPQLAEVLSFSSAVLVHLWPLCFFLIGIRIAKNESLGLLVILFFLGLAMGNCNIAESVFIFTSLVLLIYSNLRGFKFFALEYPLKVRSLISLLVGSTVGLILIVSAPGFWVRATGKTASGIPDSLASILERFLKSLVLFSADFLSHPIFYLSIFLGAIFSRRYKNFWNLKSSLMPISIMQGLLFLVLVAGATFAYPAWHQSIGLYLLAPFFGLVLSSYISSRQNRIQHVLTVFLIFVILAINIRGLELLNDRGEQWDQNRTANYCAATSSSAGTFLGAEIRYQPFALGIEDLASWDWMANSFRSWVQNQDFNPESVC
jgi:hypothetical protein